MVFYIENDVVLRGFEFEDGNVDTVVEIPEGITEINILDEDDCLSDECKCLAEGVEVIILPSSLKKMPQSQILWDSGLRT